jgi:hypothetical protein
LNRKRVFSSFNLAAVHHARNVLEAEGIRADVKNELLSSAMGELPPAECFTELWVREIDAQRAESVLKEALSAKSGPPWRCSACGESCEAQFTQCWRCGAYRER